MTRCLLILACVVGVSVASAQTLAPGPQSINVVDSGTKCVTAPKACATWPIPATTSVITSQLSGTMTSLTLTAEATLDNVNWFAVLVKPLLNGTVSTTVTATGLYAITNTGFVGFRWRCTTYASGEANATLVRGGGGGS